MHPVAFQECVQVNDGDPPVQRHRQAVAPQGPLVNPLGHGSRGDLTKFGNLPRGQDVIPVHDDFLLMWGCLVYLSGFAGTPPAFWGVGCFGADGPGFHVEVNCCHKALSRSRFALSVISAIRFAALILGNLQVVFFDRIPKTGPDVILV